MLAYIGPVHHRYFSWKILSFPSIQIFVGNASKNKSPFLPPPHDK